ncbi:unnamed protein product, partial [Larinioides sclopetarius]
KKSRRLVSNSEGLALSKAYNEIVWFAFIRYFLLKD